jgi:Arc/MetJ-type ribon-helix-helix transcriptional regulator
MKERISATVDEKTIKIIELILKKGKYRNKSHFIETAIKKIAKEEKNDKKK